MKLLSFVSLAATMLLISSCKTQEYTYNELYTPEETGLNLRNLTDGNTQPLYGSNVDEFNNAANYSTWMRGVNRKNKIVWGMLNTLTISPDKQKVAYIAYSNNQRNVMVIDVDAPSQITQRTFRNVNDVAWGVDNQLYFNDRTNEASSICSVDAEQGSLMNQHTTGNNYDYTPQLSSDGVTLYFTRWSNTGPSIWSVNTETGKLTMCAKGFQPCPDPNNHNAFYCVRNNAQQTSEIWYVDYVKGKETLIASDENHGFTNPSLSPDGKWLACTGNAYSNYSKEQNRDIFAIKTDGTKILQLTFHPYSDVNPVWGKDGKSIFFLSKRNTPVGNHRFNVWQMDVNLPK